MSPAVTVPSLVNLQDRQYGVEKGIPTMLLAAGGLDNVLCVTGFSVFMGIIFSEGMHYNCQSNNFMIIRKYISMMFFFF